MAHLPDYKRVLTKTLIPYARNSRTHSEAQVSKIAASIKEFGFLNPVIIDGSSGIIAGHGRVLAAKKLGLMELPVVEAAHLTDAQRRAYIIADNRLALDAGWDDELLRVEFDELGALGFDLELTGFSLDEINVLNGDIIPLDEVDEIKQECNIQIVCVDWTEREMAIGKLGSKKISWIDLEGMLR